MKKEKGTVILSVVLCLIIFCIFTAFTVDLGLGIHTKRQMQTASDAAALSGVQELIMPSMDPIGNARKVGQLNSLNGDEVNAPGAVEVGNWNFTTKSFLPYIIPFNAVRVSVTRTIPVYFSGVINIDTLTLNAESIAVLSGASSASCIIPFGIDSHYLIDKNYGDTIHLQGVAAPGNWGKVQIGDTKLTGSKDYDAAMVNGVCTPPLKVGDHIPTLTGDAGVTDGFEDRQAANKYVVMPVIHTFYNGNSEELVIDGFVYGEILGGSGKNGAKNWSEDIKLLDGIIMGDPGDFNLSPYAKTRVLVK